MLAVILATGLTSCVDYEYPPVPQPEGGRVGTGAWHDPMTAYQLRIGSVNDGQPAPWVTGYIVGWIDTEVGFSVSEASCKFTAPATVPSNLLISMNPKETDWTKCATVQLPSGAVRRALNLMDHPENLGALVTMRGTAGSKYMGAYGLRSVSNFNWGDKGIDTGEEPDPGVQGGTVVYQGLAEDAAEIDWTFENVTLGQGLSYVWSWKEYNGAHYLNASAYAGGSSKESLSYAVSPVISLEGWTKAQVSFKHAAKFQTTLRQLCGFAVRVAGTAEWTEVKIPVWPEAGSWSFADSGVLDLSAFDGKKVQLAFKYASSADGADTWEIKAVKLTGVKAK